MGEAKEPQERLEAALESRIDREGASVAFGDMTAADARAQGDRLSDVGSWGPLQRVVKVAQAWKLLAASMERDGAETVRELDPDAVIESAERLWVIPPPDGMIEGIRG